MKKRLGFVSNSSSSSYVCCISGNEESGMDMSLDDAGMYQCENGHVFLAEYIENFDEENMKREYVKSRLNKIPDIKWMSEERKAEEIELLNEALAIEDEDDFEEFANSNDLFDEYEYSITSNMCPVCTFKHLIPEVIAEFLMLTAHANKSAVSEMIKTDYNNYTDMLRDIKEEDIWEKKK